MHSVCKKISSIAVLLAFAVQTGGALAADVSIENPGFENGWTGWTRSASGTASSDVFYSGSKSAKISSDSGSVTQTLALTPKTNYVLSAYILGSGTLKAKVGFINYTKTGGSSSWEKTTISFNSGPASSVTITAAYADGVTRFDDFALSTFGAESSSSLASSAAPQNCTDNNPLVIVAAVDDGTHDGHGPANAIDQDMSDESRWSSSGQGKWISFDLGGSAQVKGLAFAWLKGDQRTTNFDVQISNDNVVWTPLLSGQQSSGATTGFEAIALSTTAARYVKLIGQGNSANGWNSLIEAQISGCFNGQTIPVSSSKTSSSSPSAIAASSAVAVSTTASSLAQSSVAPSSTASSFSLINSSAALSSQVSSSSQANSSSASLAACTTTVTSTSAFTTAIASAQPGDTICITGNFTSSIKVANKVGTASQPITVRATNALASTLAAIEVNASAYIVVRDFVFKSSASTLFKVVNSHHLSILANDFDFSGAGSQSGVITTADSLALNSNDITIAYNSFRDHTFPGNDFQTKQSGSYIKTLLGASGVIANRLWIHHNYFKNMAPHISAGATTPDGDSDREAIVFGEANSQTLSTNHLVEHNLFEDCDGENEIITIKTSENIVRYNTFKNSFGSVSVRFGHHSEIYGNFFFGEGASETYADPNYQTGGIRIYGTDHKVYNNYMQGLTGTTWRLPILLDNGDTDGVTGNSHQRPQRVEITNNTIVNSEGGIAIGNPGFQASYTKKPLTNKIANNIIANNRGTLMSDVGEASNLLEGNIAYVGGTAVLGVSKSAGEVWSVDPMLQTTATNGFSLQRLGSASPAINAGKGSYTYVTQDMDAEPRTNADVGADEYSANPSPSITPLNPSDVGPAASR